MESHEISVGIGERMRLIVEPVACSIPIELEKASLECEEDEGGVTCVGLLSTSHVAIHTWPEHSYAVLDVYSCRSFASDVVLGLVLNVFEVSPYNVVLSDLSPALLYPFDLPR